MMTKRYFDFLASSLGLLLLSPLFLVIAICIKLNSSGPIYFRQERVGLSGKIFSIHKFRTMAFDAEFKGPSITVSSDTRITKIGYLLRKYKLDELPQLIDVWRGSMSLVGPRPEVPKFVSYYPQEVRDVVLSVRPGITDLASIVYRDENEMLRNVADPEKFYVTNILPTKLNYYVDYVNRHSLLGDIKIIFLTIKAVIFK
jgi:lipopolysaccharide/colanic/teichoic acid biosynthesis glycosyltransferase